MKSLDPKEIIRPAAVLVIICIVIAALLAGTNELTKEPIAEQTQLQAQQAREIVLPQASRFEPVPADAVQSLGLPDGCYFALDKDNRVIGVTITTAAKGYGGDITVIVGIDSTQDSVSGVSILSQDETPGLGSNATNAEFTDQYKQPLPQNGFSVIKNAQPKDGEIAAITGATITSDAVTAAVNEALSVYNNTLKKYDVSLGLWEDVLSAIQAKPDSSKGGAD